VVVHLQDLDIITAVDIVDHLANEVCQLYTAFFCTKPYFNILTQSGIMA